MLWVFILVVLILGFWWRAYRLFRSRSPGAPFVVGHRGAAASAPENTLAGLREGRRQLAFWLEVDVRRTADDELVLLHDATLDRTTNGSGCIELSTWADVQQLDAGSWFAAAFAGEPVPRLEAALRYAVAEDVKLVVEVKEPARYPGIGRQLTELIETCAAASHVVVISFAGDWLARFKARTPGLETGALYGPSDRVPTKTRHEYVDVHWRRVLGDPTLVFRLHRRQRRVFVYTVDRVWLMVLLGWLGVDGITSNRPGSWPGRSKQEPR
ncbi:MAG: glycerophosphodiester phosphodiesterase family protein [bacterium]